MSETKRSPHLVLSSFFSKIKSIFEILKNKVLNLPQEPKLIVSDLPGWAPRKPRAFIKTLLVIGILVTGSWIFIRSLDSGYDDPNKFEQVYNLNNWYTSLRKSVSIDFNLFGTSAASYSNVNARLVRVLGERKNLPIIDLENEYIRLSSENVRPGDTKITLSAHPNHQNLKQALDKMIQTGFAQFSESSKVRGEVYSLELALDVYRDGQKIQTVAEIFHFRVDKIIEKLFVLLISFSAAFAVLYIADLTKTVIYYRAGEVLNAIAALILEFLKLVKSLMDISNHIPIDMPKPLGAPLRALMERIIRALETFLKKTDKIEGRMSANQTYNEIRGELQELKNSATRDSESFEGKKLFEYIYNKIERIQALLRKLRKRNIRPLTRHEMRKEISEANEALQNAYKQLKGIIDDINNEREKVQVEHDTEKENRKNKIASGINNFLNRSYVQRDIDQLSKVFPLEVHPSEIFKTPDIYAKGETELISGKLQLTFPFFSFPVPNSECGTDKPIWIKIVKTNRHYVISQPDPNKKLNICQGIASFAVLDSFGKEQRIQFIVRLKENLTIEENDEIEINNENIELINPNPDPQKLLNKIDLPPRPKIVKIK